MPAALIPLHTRMISLRLTRDEATGFIADGRIVDVRKRGVLPMGGRIKGPGVVHDMAVRMHVDPQLTIRSLQPTMAAFPFVAGPMTGGESCADRLPDVQRLMGSSLRNGFAPTLIAEVGGPRGCFHVFTMLRLLGPSIAWAVDHWRQLHGERADAAPGTPMFSRTIIIDGSKSEGLSLLLQGTLCDIHFTPGAEAFAGEEVAGESFEAAAEVTVEVPAMRMAAPGARVRRLRPGADEAWQEVPLVDHLGGRAMFKGYSTEVQALFATSAGLEPLQDLLLMLAPALLQCMPSLAEELRAYTDIGDRPRSAVDSCHMWRVDGPLMTAPPWPSRGRS